MKINFKELNSSHDTSKIKYKINWDYFSRGNFPTPCKTKIEEKYTVLVILADNHNDANTTI
jgi:hypothetical protein